MIERTVVSDSVPFRPPPRSPRPSESLITNKQYRLPWTGFRCSVSRINIEPHRAAPRRVALRPPSSFPSPLDWVRGELGPHGMPNRSRGEPDEYLPGRPLSCINIRYTTFLFDLRGSDGFNNIIALGNNASVPLRDRSDFLVPRRIGHRAWDG